MSSIEIPRWVYKDKPDAKDVSGYESPIKRVVQEVSQELIQKENQYLMDCVRKVGFEIDEKELAKALEYDRQQYEKGVADERRRVESIMRELYNCKNERGKHYIKEYMRDVLERLSEA